MSILGHPGQAQAFAEPLSPSKVSRIVAEFAGTHAADGKARVERKRRLCSGSRRIYSAEQPQASGQVKMGRGEIAVGLNASSCPRDRFDIRAELALSHAYKMHPLVGPQIARGETESLEYMTFGLGRLTHKILGQQ